MSGKKIALFLIVILLLCGGILLFLHTQKRQVEIPSPEKPLEQSTGKPGEKTPGESPPGKLIATIDPASFMMHTFAVSPDNTRVAFWEKGDGGQHVVADGKKGKKYVFDPRSSQILFSPDSKRIAYIVNEGGRAFTVIDGKEDKKYLAIVREHVYFSPDSKRTVYVGKKSRDVMTAVLDGKEGKEYFGIVGDISFSPDSKQIAYISRDEDYMYPVIDGKEMGKYAGVRQNITFSPDSKRTAYFARGVDYKSVVLDEKKIRKYKVSFLFNNDTILNWNELLKKLKEHKTPPVKRIWDFLDDKSKAAISSWKPGQVPDEKLKSTVISSFNEMIKKKDLYRKQDFMGIKFYHTLLRRNILGRVDRLIPLRVTHFNRQLLYNIFPAEIKDSYIDSKEFGLIFSPDSKKLAYSFKMGKWFVDVDGKEQNKYDDIGTLPIFSSDSKHLAYVATKDGNEFVVIDGKEEGKYDAIGSNPIFSPDGKKLAYAAMEGDKQFIVSGGKEEKKYDYLVKENTIIQINSKCGVHVLNERGKEFSVCGDKGGRVLLFSKKAVLFSPDGSQMVYAAGENGKEFIVVDDKEQKKYDKILTFPIFSSDGKHIAYVVQENGKEFVVIDGEEQRKFDKIITECGGKIVFDSHRDSIHYLVRNGNNIYLVEDEFPKNEINEKK